MELLLERTYHPTGTDGILSIAERFCCYTIELPWRDNRRRISCIPEGRYPIALRFSKRHQYHLLVQTVPGRSLILIHKATNALKELKGCIAPVQESLKPGIGRHSAHAFKALMLAVQEAMDQGEPVTLTITRLANRYLAQP
ncbi:DUF5675 family protein [Flavihumibacter petaseus]|uniref:DUF5675 domain-containing protein n=1 Tax=Flavihumibacter petaseus NBRC 106054 TaxID=1220578 RepID=A0A0E9MY17_9BACT|nr:DUF5675 family protein [Flavihumibacter petaseus]GAO42336.1 hypothetical protein FPE01S_01_13500 [Flavihumibacter petaseus NBRC 106054]